MYCVIVLLLFLFCFFPKKKEKKKKEKQEGKKYAQSRFLLFTDLFFRNTFSQRWWKKVLLRNSVKAKRRNKQLKLIIFEVLLSFKTHQKNPWNLLD